MIEHDSHWRGVVWRVCIPSVALMVIALSQVTLAKTAALCPWKGGGFGMFATTDNTDARDVRVFVESPGSSKELSILPAQKIDATQAMLFPSDRMLTRLALTVVNREQSDDPPISAVRLEVWRTEFDIGSLEATRRLVRTFTYHVDQSID